MVRLIIWFVVGFLIYTAFQAVKKAFLKPPSPPPEKTARGEEMIQDPECGTYVPRSGAIKAQAKGSTRYFCSTTCRDKFLARG